MDDLKPPTTGSVFARLCAFWVYGGSMGGVVLLALTPFVASGWTLAQTLVFTCLPAYMIHQFEEHDADRFRTFINTRLGCGMDVLTARAVFVINVIGVWCVLGAIIAATFAIDPRIGLAAGYFLAINGALHLVQGFALRCYNPGLATGVAVFLPLGTSVVVTASAGATGVQHGLAIALVLAIHAMIVANVAIRRRRLMRGPATA